MPNYKSTPLFRAYNTKSKIATPWIETLAKEGIKDIYELITRQIGLPK